jgi:hypothetical protein
LDVGEKLWIEILIFLLSFFIHWLFELGIAILFGFNLLGQFDIIFKIGLMVSFFDLWFDFQLFLFTLIRQVEFFDNTSKIMFLLNKLEPLFSFTLLHIHFHFFSLPSIWLRGYLPPTRFQHLLLLLFLFELFQVF